MELLFLFEVGWHEEHEAAFTQVTQFGAQLAQFDPLSKVPFWQMQFPEDSSLEGAQEVQFVGLTEQDWQELLHEVHPPLNSIKFSGQEAQSHSLDEELYWQPTGQTIMNKGLICKLLLLVHFVNIAPQSMVRLL